MLQELLFSSSKKHEMIDLTKKIEELVNNSEIKEGLCVVYCPHTTAGITINENADPDVKEDIIKTLSRLIPESENYKHSEGNSDGHLKSSLLGNEKSIIIKDGSLLLGTWQGIYFFEGDGPRNRKIYIKILKG